MKLEMRIFDGRMNQTKEQAKKDFEKHYGYLPEENRESSPDQITPA